MNACKENNLRTNLCWEESVTRKKSCALISRDFHRKKYESLFPSSPRIYDTWFTCMTEKYMDPACQYNFGLSQALSAVFHWGFWDVSTLLLCSIVSFWWCFQLLPISILNSDLKCKCLSVFVFDVWVLFSLFSMVDFFIVWGIYGFCAPEVSSWKKKEKKKGKKQWVGVGYGGGEEIVRCIACFHVDVCEFMHVNVSVCVCVTWFLLSTDYDTDGTRYNVYEGLGFIFNPVMYCMFPFISLTTSRAPHYNWLNFNRYRN